jgi:hypothetical protein
MEKKVICKEERMEREGKILTIIINLYYIRYPHIIRIMLDKRVYYSHAEYRKNHPEKALLQDQKDNSSIRRIVVIVVTGILVGVSIHKSLSL